MELKIITGMSGAGKSSALKIFEDLGYYPMDNVPCYLIEKYIELNKLQEKPIEKMAVVVDFRSQTNPIALVEDIKKLKFINEDTQIIFLQASDKKITIRYNELRRPHPFGEFGDVIDGINKENTLLKDIKRLADYLIDTTNYNYSDLKIVIEEIAQHESKFILNISSFGYKYGIPEDANFIFDVRFLPNPYYNSDLRNLNGTNRKLQDYLDSFKLSIEFLDDIIKMLEKTVEGYIKQGKSMLNVSFGCTGGKHRSVYMAEKLSEKLKDKSWIIVKKHRDGDKW
ncbi:MAG: RNase adapter RapZ [Tissierellia bacterium]|nr:RNase adapter RapZ [Tissierellia bacterium]